MSEKPVQCVYTAEEMRAIADVVDAINKLNSLNTLIGVVAAPEIWWVDRLIGRIVLLDPSESDSEYGYRPEVWE